MTATDGPAPGPGPAQSRRGDPVRVLVVDDHPLMREGLRAVLRAAGIDLVGEAPSGEAALEMLPAAAPDVILMDLNLPGMNGLDATRACKAALPSAAVLVFTGHESIEFLEAAVTTGAAGYVLKAARSETLIRAVLLVHAGESVIETHMCKQLLRVFRERLAQAAPAAAPTVAAGLTPLERSVLRAVVQGNTNGEIARDLHYSVGTVKNAVQRIIEKLGVSDRTQAAVLAVRAGFFPEEDAPQPSAT